MMNKKGYYFVIDTIVAIIILGLGYMVISAFHPNTNEELFQENLANDLMDIMGTTNINEICPEIDSCSCIEFDIIQDACLNAGPLSNPGVKNTKNTILEMMGELHHKDSSNDEDFSQNIIDEILKRNRFRNDIVGIRIDLFDENDDGYLLFRNGYENDLNIRNKIVVKRVIFGYWEDPSTGEIEFWGPYLIKMELWQKP